NSFENRGSSRSKEDNSVMLSACPPTGKADCPEGGERAGLDGMANLGHQPQIVRHVVQRQERRSQHLIHVEEMVQIRPTEMPARVTWTIGLKRLRISLVPGIAHF